MPLQATPVEKVSPNPLRFFPDKLFPLLPVPCLDAVDHALCRVCSPHNLQVFQKHLPQVHAPDLLFPILSAPFHLHDRDVDAKHSHRQLQRPLPLHFVDGDAMACRSMYDDQSWTHELCRSVFHLSERLELFHLLILEMYTLTPVLLLFGRLKD